MSEKKISLSPYLKAFRYSVSYTERYFKYLWKQTIWVLSQGKKYRIWIQSLSIHTGWKIALCFFFPVFGILWTILALWGFIKSI